MVFFAFSSSRDDILLATAPYTTPPPSLRYRGIVVSMLTVLPRGRNCLHAGETVPTALRLIRLRRKGTTPATLFLIICLCSPSARLDRFPIAALSALHRHNS
ncbi:hypothetical protein BDW22DRAFT_1362244 [Trametopsis cervina]|nr:hypothetical protein BDW22DRAFT_1362244 [Trametopsis cervina]